MRHHTPLRSLKRTIRFSLSIMLLFFLASAVLATRAMPKTITSTLSSLPGSLSGGGNMTGTVTDSNGTPLAEVRVEVYQYNEPYDNWTSRGSDETGASGQYDVGDLNPGIYRVHFDDVGRYYLSEYYDNAPDIRSASDVMVTVGQTTTGIDASLTEGGHITGTVSDEAGNPLSGIRVGIYRYRETNEASPVLNSYLTDSFGQYELLGLNTGTYQVRFSDWRGNYLGEYYDDTPDIGNASDVTVTLGQTTTGIDASLSQAGHITGTVSDAALGNPLERIEVSLYQYNEEQDDWQLLKSRHTDSSGQYKFDGLQTGTYRVRFDHRQHRYLSEYYDNAPDLERASDVHVTAGQTTTGIDASLSQGGYITGIVRDKTGENLQRINVTVYQYNEEEEDWQWLRSEESDSRGQYEIHGLNTNTYRVAFSARGRYVSQYYDNVPDLERASEVAVIAGETTIGINASLVETGRITGTVTDAALGNPVEHIRVLVIQYDEQNESWRIAYGDTDSSGQYDVRGLNTGTYRVVFADYQEGPWNFDDRQRSYATEFYDDAFDLESASDLYVTAGQTMTGIDASLTVGGNITGTISDALGNPLSGIVTVYQYNEQEDDWQSLGSHYSASSGQYYVDDLNTGTYRVRFEKRGYVTQYYDNAFDIESASDVAVTAGQTTTGINISLSEGGQITGTLSDEAGNPLQRIQVDLYQYNEQEGNWERTRSNYSNFYGQYHVDLLAPDTYRLHFLDSDNNYLSEYYDNAADLESATDITVIAEQTISGIDASLAPASQIQGTVSASDDSRLRNIAVDLYRSDGNGGWQWAAQDLTNPRGHYLINGLPPGTYRVGFFDWEGNYFTKYHEDATDLASASDLLLTAGESRADIDVTLEEGGHITGTISHEISNIAHVMAGTEPLEGIEVQAYRHDGGEWQWVRSATTDADGQYDLGGLTSGSYRVGFFEPFGKYAYEYYDDSSNLAGATNISVTAGQSTPNIDAILADAATPLAQVTSEAGVSVDAQTGQITIMQRNGNPSNVTISLLVTCPDGETASDVTLRIGEQPYLMSAGGNQQYSATIPANEIVDDAQLTVSKLCNGNTEEQTIGQIQLFEPIGQLTDAETGELVAGATIALYKVPGWQAKTSSQDSRPHTCQSNLSKAPDTSWSQEAPTELGVMAMSDPNSIGSVITPLISDAEGYYGFSVVRGCWYVVVEAAGYNRLISPVVGMPPAVTDLDLALTPKEPLRMQFRAVNYQINENLGSAQVIVIATTPPTQTLTVDYSTSNGTATAGEDYTTATGTLTFAPGQTFNSFNVPILDDDAEEGKETIDLTLSNPTNVVLGERARATVTIGDNDGQLTSSHEIYLPMMIKTSE